MIMNLKRILLSLMAATTVALAACGPAATPAPAAVVQRYYEAVNAKQLDAAMAFIADDAVFVNPYGTFRGKDDVRASLQLVMNDGITFDLSNFRDTNGRVVYDYKVFVNGEQVEVGTDGLTIVRDGKITLDATERWEWAAYVNNVSFTAEGAGFGGPDTIPAGWTEITLTNSSQGIHHVQLVKLDGGKTPEDLKAALEADPENFPAWAIPYGGPNAPDPGGSTSAIVKLDAGNYALISVIPNAEGVPGFLNGMIKALTVTEASGAAALEPQADLTVDLTEFALGVSGSIAAGQHVIRFNNMGRQVHEAYLVKLNDGVTAEAYLNTPPTEPPPAVSLGGITGIASGAHQYINVTLEPGNYALFCFFPDPASHAPHFVLGMVQEFVVK
jgi:limonene-1,2-epoxide hydrolase